MNQIELLKKYCDVTEVDVHRVFRPGGPLDSTLYETNCKKCGLKLNRSLRWFINRNGRCRCGGEFDFRTLDLLNQRMILRWLFLTKSAAELLQIFWELGWRPEEEANGRN